MDHWGFTLIDVGLMTAACNKDMTSSALGTSDSKELFVVWLARAGSGYAKSIQRIYSV